MEIIFVSSCLLKKNNKILITSRPKNKFLGGFWELPGGKLFKDESFENCAIRELSEEIGIKIDIENLNNIDLITHRYKNNLIIMMVYLVEYWLGKIRAKEEQKLAWINRDQISNFNFLPGSQIFFDRVYENYYKFFK
ncbi:MAG: (deoxy)nucleoside triphosphate pyrophosphohydrolase [Candidatus Fonsibacter sp.]|nr:(deoxy)nucleoside triphosphate pyrophosphohydrolase [Candidatus Fonsibacter sp.]